MIPDLPRYVYHGTTQEAAKTILKSGIRPRRMTKDEGHWDAHPSIDTHVYLSTLYAPYFAMAASGRSGSAPTVLEVDLHKLDPSRLMPDEDFVEQSHRKYADHWDKSAPVPPEGTMQERMDFIRPRIQQFQFMWMSSVRMFGNLAHRGVVPADAITRAVSFTGKSNSIISSIDPTITIENALYLGDRYAAISRWWAGDSVTAAEIDGFGGMSPPGMEEQFAARAEEQGRILAERPDMEVLL